MSKAADCFRVSNARNTAWSSPRASANQCRPTAASLAPVPVDEREFAVTRSAWIFRNLPPARVWVYRRKA